MAIGLGLIISSSVAPGRADELSFGRDIRPILSQHCFQCHGPDDAAREAGLRLDQREGALAEADSGTIPIVPGNPAESELVRRILSDDEFEQMPPPEIKKPLSEKQKELLTRWISEGAEYHPHWSFVKPTRPELPQADKSSWPHNEIDHFVLARMTAAGLSPTPQAAPEVLLRRVYLDLIGLVPTPEQRSQFLEQVSSQGLDKAYAATVEQLLQSPRYGERWARRWLDLARYADTNGYEKDRPREIWAYRDWVIDAINRDLPFDQFTIEQLAGDLLPDASLEQRIATGFHRNTMLNEEGGIDPLEFRFHAMTDRVGTTGTTWLGLTIECAQCHTHKYDPLPHREYYQFMAFLNNADEPEMDLPNQAAQEDYQRRMAEADQLVQSLPSKFPDGEEPLRQRFEQWLEQQRAATVDWQALRPVEARSNLPLLTVEAEDSVYVSGDTAKTDVFYLTYDLSDREGDSPITALRLEALPDPRLPEHGPGLTYYEGTRGDFFLGEFRLQAGGQPVSIQKATHSYAKNRFGNNPVSAELSIDGDPQTGWSVHDRQGERHVAIYELAEPLSVSQLELEMVFGRHFASSLGRFRVSATQASPVPAARDYSAEIEALLAKPADQLRDDERGRLWETFLLEVPELEEPAKRIRALRKAPELPTTLVLQERPPENPRPTYLHKRGEFLQPDERVEPATPSVLHPFPEDAPRNRLGFARWLVSPDNPLTARVVMNRDWAAFFGEGIVTTVQDFGFQGAPPTHPDLLDWLAVEFMQNGWSRKHMHRKIVLSATYRQSSGTPGAETEPARRWLSGLPRKRLEAEVIRDSVLQVAGLLSLKTGGPGIRPPQPAGVTEAAWGKPSWQASQGEDRYRRSIYTFIKRTAPFAMYNTFDAPSGEACVAQRDTSNTPLQALTLLNDPMFVEAAQAFGALLAESEGTEQEVIELAFRRVLTREPSADERQAVAAFLDRQRKRIEAGELEVDAILRNAPRRAPSQPEQAAWTLLARALYSLDETITRN